MAYFKPYKSYNWKDRNPVFDQLRTVISDEGAKLHDIHNDSGVSMSTLYRYFTKCTAMRPSHDAVAAIAGALGYDFVLKERGRGAKIIDFPKRHRRAHVNGNNKRRTSARAVV